MLTQKEMTYYDVLRSVELFSELDPAQLRKLAVIATSVEFDTDEIVYHAGDQGKGLYIIQEGQVTIEMITSEYGPITLYTLKPGQLFGWSSLIPGRLKKARARVLRPTKAIFIDADEIRYMFNRDYKLENTFMNCIMSVIANRMDTTREKLARQLPRAE